MNLIVEAKMSNKHVIVCAATLFVMAAIPSNASAEVRLGFDHSKDTRQSWVLSQTNTPRRLGAPGVKPTQAIALEQLAALHHFFRPFVVGKIAEKLQIRRVKRSAFYRTQFVLWVAPARIRVPAGAGISKADVKDIYRKLRLVARSKNQIVYVGWDHGARGRRRLGNRTVIASRWKTPYNTFAGARFGTVTTTTGGIQSPGGLRTTLKPNSHYRPKGYGLYTNLSKHMGVVVHGYRVRNGRVNPANESKGAKVWRGSYIVDALVSHAAPADWFVARSNAGKTVDAFAYERAVNHAQPKNATPGPTPAAIMGAKIKTMARAAAR